MKKRVIGITALFAIVILAVTGMLWYMGRRNASMEDRRDRVVAINELEELVRSGEEAAFFEKADFLYGIRFFFVLNYSFYKIHSIDLFF